MIQWNNCLDDQLIECHGLCPFTNENITIHCKNGHWDMDGDCIHVEPFCKCPDPKEILPKNLNDLDWKCDHQYEIGSVCNGVCSINNSIGKILKKYIINRDTFNITNHRFRSTSSNLSIF